MMELTASEEEFFKLDMGKGPMSLGNLSRIELTLNHPRTAKFKRMDSEQQRAHYSKWLDQGLAPYKTKIKKLMICFEQCRDGTEHVHLDIELQTTAQFYPCGLVSDIVKNLLDFLPPKHGIKTFNLCNYNCLYWRYVCPSICCQVRDIEDRVRALEWEVYINKAQ